MGLKAPHRFSAEDYGLAPDKSPFPAVRALDRSACGPLPFDSQARGNQGIGFGKWNLYNIRVLIRAQLARNAS